MANTNTERSTTITLTKTSEDTSGKDTSTGTEMYIKLPKPRPFTRAKVNTVEYRPAAVLPVCQFLNALSAKCKSDLAKLGCSRHHHPHAAQEKATVTNLNQPKRHKHVDREPWEKRMLRLKVYQRAFSAIVMHFKAYCPVLFYIKKTYEDMLSYRINQIKLAHFEKKRLRIQKQNMKQQMNDYIFPEHYQLMRSETYLTILRQRITLQEEAIKVITGILKKMEESLSDHFERHRDLEEQIVMVDTEIANRRQKAFSMREKEEQEGKEREPAAAENNTITYFDEPEEEDKDDPFYNVDDVDEDQKMVWIMAFAICHKDLEDAERKLNMYQTKYQYVVPRHELENMKHTIIDEKFASRELADEKSALEGELKNLNALEVKLAEELTEVKHQLSDLRTLVTPRPSWEQLGEFIQGGVPKWEKMIQGKSTKDVTEKLFTELRSRRGGEKFIQPLGIETSVLRCLRHAKKIPDRQLHSRDAALMINDIWAQRNAALYDHLHASKKGESDFDFGKTTENLAIKSFPDFVAIYFENMYEDVDQRMEWTYNLVECCRRFSLDYRLTQFLSVLQQKSDEGVYTAIRNELFRIRNSLLQRSLQENMSNGTLSSNQYVEALEITFPRKGESELQALVRVTNKLNVELNPGDDADLSTYRITQLIDVRDDGFRGALVSEFVKQFEENRLMFIDKVIEEIATLIDVNPAAAMKETDPVGERDVSVIQAYVALTKADSDLDDTAIGATLAWLFTGTSVRPGSGISTSRLVNFCKINQGKVGHGHEANTDPLEDDKFERAIKDIIREEEETKDGEHQMSEKQKKSYYKAHRHAKLRTVVKRLKGSALVPSWQAYDPADCVLPQDAVDLNKDLESLRKVVRATINEPTLHLPMEEEHAYLGTSGGNSRRHTDEPEAFPDTGKQD